MPKANLVRPVRPAKPAYTSLWFSAFAFSFQLMALFQSFDFVSAFGLESDVGFGFQPLEALAIYSYGIWPWL